MFVENFEYISRVRGIFFNGICIWGKEKKDIYMFPRYSMKHGIAVVVVTVGPLERTKRFQNCHAMGICLGDLSDPQRCDKPFIAR